MTAPAAAPAAGAVVLPAPRTASQPAADRFAFAAMLDSLPGAAPKAGAASAAAEGSRTSSDTRRGEAQSAEPSGHPVPDGGALLSGLPFALTSALVTTEASAPVEAPAAAAAPAPMKGASVETSGASVASTVEPTKPAAARFVGERAFHLAPATSSLAGAGSSPAAGRTPTETASLPPAPALGESANAPKAPPALASLPMHGRGSAPQAAASAQSVSRPPAATPPTRSAAPAASKGPALGAAPGAVRSPSQTTSPTRTAAQDPVRGGRKGEVAAQPSAPRVRGPAAAAAESEPSDKADGPPPDPAQSTAQPAPQASAFAAPSALSGAAGWSSEPSDAAAADLAPRTSAPAAAPARAAPAVKEIDVDLSPTGLEDVSMTMRLAGEKLSVVVRAASSQTAGSIEAARDAIADRLAAIGQPLDSLIVGQTGANADPAGNGNGASADEGSTSGQSLAGRGAGGQGGSSDASSSRRGAARDRGY